MAKSIERINFSLETAMKTVRGRKWRANGKNSSLENNSRDSFSLFSNSMSAAQIAFIFFGDSSAPVELSGALYGVA